MTFLKSNLKLIPNLIKSNILLDEFLFPKISFYETLLRNHDYQCNNDTNKFRGRYNEKVLDESEGEQKEIFLFSNEKETFLKNWKYTYFIQILEIIFFFLN